MNKIKPLTYRDCKGETLIVDTRDATKDCKLVLPFRDTKDSEKLKVISLDNRMKILNRADLYFDLTNKCYGINKDTFRTIKFLGV